MEDGKFCKGCKVDFPKSCFDKHSSTSDKLHPKCKGCRKKERRAKGNNLRPALGTIVTCAVCKEDMDESFFHSDKYKFNGLQSRCKICTEKVQSKSYSQLPQFISVLFKDTKKNAKTRGIKVEVTKEDILNIYEKQKGICAITGRKLTSIKNAGEGRNRNLNNISIDRIDPKRDYVIDNIQLVTKIANSIKWTNTMTEMCELACIVTEHYQSHGKEFLEQFRESHKISKNKEKSKGLTFKSL